MSGGGLGSQGRRATLRGASVPDGRPPQRLWLALAGLGGIVGMFLGLHRMDVGRRALLASTTAIMQNVAVASSLLFLVSEQISKAEAERRKLALDFTAMSEHGWIQVERLFLDHPDLAPFYYEINGALGAEPPSNLDAPRSPEVRRKEFHVISILLQIMEDVYYVEDLATTYDSSGMAGWLSTFRGWLAAPTVARAWPGLSSYFSRPFRLFVETRILPFPVRALARAH
jgi:hypothetical protein